MRDARGRFAKEGAAAGSGPATRWRRATLGEFGKVFSALPPQVKGVLVAGAVASAPLLAATVSAALTAGISGGAVAAGVALAARDPRRQGRGVELGATMLSTLQGAATPFIGPTLSAINTLRNAFADAGGDISDIFRGAARFVEPLAAGIAGLIRNVLPAISRAIARAGPVMDVLARGLPRIGDAISDAFDDMTQNAGDAAGAMEWIIIAVSGVIRAVGSAVGTLTGWFSNIVDFNLGIARAVEAVAKLNPLTSGTIGDVARDQIANLEGMKNAIDTAGTSAAGAAGPTNAFGGALLGAAAGVQSLNERMREGAEANSSYLGGLIGMEQAIDDADRRREGKRRRTTSTPRLAGRTSAHSTRWRRRSERTRQSDRAEGQPRRGKRGHGPRPAEVHRRRRCHELLEGRGGEAGYATRAHSANHNDHPQEQQPRSRGRGRRLKSKLLGVEAPTAPTLRSAGAQSAIARANAVQAAVNRLTGKTIRIGVVGGRGGVQEFSNRWGGVYTPAREGVMRLREAAVQHPQPRSVRVRRTRHPRRGVHPPQRQPRPRPQHPRHRRRLARRLRRTGPATAQMVASSRTTVINYHLHAGVVGSGMELETGSCGCPTARKAAGPLLMPADYDVRIDWDGDGTFTDVGDDISARVFDRGTTLSIRYGRDRARALSPLAPAEHQFELDNSSRDYCLEVDAEALVFNRGWVTHDQLRVGDMVLTYDPEDDGIRWEPVASINRVQWSGDLIRWRSSKSIDVATTPNHQWWTVGTSGRARYEPRFRTTQEVSGHQLFVKIGGGTPDCFAAEPTYSDDFVDLLGWVFTEGWFESGQPLKKRTCARCNAAPARNVCGRAVCDGCARSPLGSRARPRPFGRAPTTGRVSVSRSRRTPRTSRAYGSSSSDWWLQETACPNISTPPARWLRSCVPGDSRATWTARSVRHCRARS